MRCVTRRRCWSMRGCPSSVTFPCRRPNRSFRRARSRIRAGGRRSTASRHAEAAVYHLDDMAPGQEIAGPALIETETTTVLVGAGDRATITATSWIDIVVG